MLLRRFFGSKPLLKRHTPIAIHASQRPEAPVPDNYDDVDLTFKPSMTSPLLVIERTAWTPPPENRPDLPFLVERTHIGKNLPVYTDIRAGKTKVVTYLRRCRGDILLLQKEMEKVCGKPVTIRPGKLVVDGNYTKRLKLWLAGLGF